LFNQKQNKTKQNKTNHTKPGIIEGARFGKGRGRQVIAVARFIIIIIIYCCYCFCRTCNLILIVLDALHPLTHKKVMEVFFFILK
jgi:ribosome-interacting GTPase 1